MLKSQDASLDAIKASGLHHRISLGVESPSGKRPAVVLVHGRAGDADVMWIVSRALERVKPIVISPQGFLPDPVQGFIWWPITDANGNRKPRTTADDLRTAIPKLKHFIEACTAFYNLDSKRLYAFGFSQGAGLLSALSLQHPNLLQGIAFLSGFIPTVIDDEPDLMSDEVKNKQANLPSYFISHGSEDNIVPVDRAERAKNILESYGAEVELYIDSVKHKTSSAGIAALGNWFDVLVER